MKIIFKQQGEVLQTIEEFTAETQRMVQAFDPRQISSLEFHFIEGVFMGDTHDLTNIDPKRVEAIIANLR